MLLCELENQDRGTLTFQEDATEASSDVIVAPSHMIFSEAVTQNWDRKSGCEAISLLPQLRGLCVYGVVVKEVCLHASLPDL